MSAESSTSRTRVIRLTLFLVGAFVGALVLRVVDAPDPAERDDAAQYVVGETGSESATGTDAPTTFRIASLNVLGHGHTAPGGNRTGYASGPERMRLQVDKLRRHQVDVVGFQELQAPQVREFNKLTGTQYDIWPGNIDGPGFLRNSIAWDTGEWGLVRSSWLRVPYFDGVLLRMPVVLLANVETGQQAYFMNFQNPADARGNAERWRDEGRALQLGLVNRLRAQSGLPVYWTGDFNERKEAFCHVTRASDMVSASGGLNDGRTCSPTKPLYVDWIFGSVETTFSGYLADRSAKVARSTDHPLVVATASLPPSLMPNCPTTTT